VSDPLRFSRFRRLPGLYRIRERKLPDPHEEPQLLSLYISGRLLDKAEALAMKTGVATVQEYCQKLLGWAIESQEEAAKAAEVEIMENPLKSLDALANEPDYLAAWTSSHRETVAIEGPEPVKSDSLATLTDTNRYITARDVVLRHAALLGEDSSLLLASLRRGEAVGPEAARELLQALIDLEAQLRPVEQIDRRLAYALHRLAFEGQILLAEGPANHLASDDPATVDLLRMVQEAVDRVLSGEDIRYYAERSQTGDNPS